jgi:hypothetical protein
MMIEFPEFLGTDSAAEIHFINIGNSRIPTAYIILSSLSHVVMTPFRSRISELSQTGNDREFRPILSNSVLIQFQEFRADLAHDALYKFPENSISFRTSNRFPEIPLSFPSAYNRCNGHNGHNGAEGGTEQ